MEKNITLENVEKIEYRTNYNHTTNFREYPLRIVRWQEVLSGEYTWVRYEIGDEDECRGPFEINSEDGVEILKLLKSAGGKLGVELNSPVDRTNIKTLVEIVAEKITNSDHTEVYRKENGTKIYLKRANS